MYIYIYLYIYIYTHVYICICICDVLPDPGALNSCMHRMISFQNTLTPNPKKLYRCCSVTKQTKHMFLRMFFECFQVPVPVVW